MATPVKDAAWLRWIEKLAEPSHTESAGTVRPSAAFRCRLETQPDHLVPEHYLRNQGGTVSSGRPLFVNPNSWLAQNGEAPNAMRSAADLLPSLVLEPQCTVWIKDPGCGTTLPFWLNSALSKLLSSLHPRESAPASLPLETRRALLMAGVFVPEDWIETRTREWAAAVSRGADEFQRKGFLPVRELIHPFHISALRRYFRYLIRTGQMRLGDGQCCRRYIAHDDPVARFFHLQLTQAVSALADEPLKPSYVYASSYQAGAHLDKHTDREQCEFSLTFCLDYSPEPELATPWPLELHTSCGKATIFQALGDGLLYRGRAIPHSRPLLPRGHTSTSIFFHYVRKDFCGSLS